MSSFHVISIGDLVADVVVAIPELPVEADFNQLVREIQLEPGGAGNFLIAGARLGMQMEALGAVGEDIYGAAILDILAGEWVEINRVLRQKGGTTTTVFVLVDDSGHHVFLGHYGEGPDVILPESWRQALAGADAVTAFGYTLQEKRMARSMMDGLRFANSRGIPVFFDPGPFMQTATEEERNIILSCCHAILMTEQEIPFMTGGKSGIEAARGLLDAGPKIICIKRGLQGCQIFTKEGTAQHEGYHVKVVDTTGAGDTFAAAFVYAYLQGWSIEKIASFANAMGAAMVQKLGSGRHAPSWEDINQIIRE
jgi:sugar/nucleoside kinase (ribokinase family)